jgi:drug/metabolite transporter (DMT)-like permease
MSDAFLGYALASSALLFFTAAILGTKAASNRMDLSLGFLIATFANVVFAGAALGVQLLVQAGSLDFNARAFWYFAAAGFFSTYLGRWFFYESVVRFGAAKASIFQVSSPVFTALIAWAVLGESLPPLVLGAMLLAVVGLVVVAAKPGALAAKTPPLAQPGPSTAQRLLGSVLILGAGSSLAYAVGNVLRGAAVRSWNEPIVGALVGAVTGLLLYLIFTPNKSQLVARMRAADKRGVWLYALIGVFTIAGQTSTIAAMRYIPLSIATLVTLCTPLLVFPLSQWLLKGGEPITRNTLIGSAMAFAGIVIIVLR